jgi:hypothetical protein
VLPRVASRRDLSARNPSVRDRGSRLVRVALGSSVALPGRVHQIENPQILNLVM